MHATRTFPSLIFKEGLMSLIVALRWYVMLASRTHVFSYRNKLRTSFIYLILNDTNRSW